MIKTIYKYLVTPDCTINMPKGAEILCVQVQNNDPYIWALVDVTQPLVGVKLITIGTGHPIDENSLNKYIGTFELDSFVFHVFETPNK